ncbi:MAG: OmpA family protein [Bacteroidetes bacterium]|nr:OmpA family protein [Bacteroidota bacterium]
MKKILLYSVAIIFLSVIKAHAQFGDILNHVKDKAKEKVEQGIDKTMDNATSGKKKDGTKNSNNANNNNGNSNSNNTAADNSNQVPTIISYKNYDFVPGDTVIFQSNLADEEVGEIPSQFTLSHGQMDIQVEDGENVIHIPSGPGATLTPRMSTTTYMPDQFTIEFDFKNEKFGLCHLMVDFGHRTYYSGGEGITPGMTFDNTSVTWTLGDVSYPDELQKILDKPMQWHHIAIAINKTVGKIYVDQFRVANVNNLTGKPNNVTIDVNGYENSYIKNVRIAAGGINIYKKITTLTKIVTHGILFDVDKATLKPQSMGTINEIYNVLKRDPSLKFEIDGHTDNTGNAAQNLTLSQQRADAVKTELVSLGIDASRLTTKGFGDTKPMDTNDTPEGKANNRRVEFVKI